MIEIYLKENPDCSILVLDGILDLISDFNFKAFNLIYLHFSKNIYLLKFVINQINHFLKNYYSYKKYYFNYIMINLISYLFI